MGDHVIKYWIKIGDIVLSNANYNPAGDYMSDPEKANADLIELTMESNVDNDGQTFYMRIANIDHKYTGAWIVTTTVEIVLIDEGYTADPITGKPKIVYVDVFPTCLGTVTYVEYDLYTVTIKGSFIEDDLGADQPYNDIEVSGLTVKDAVIKVLMDYLTHTRPIIDRWEVDLTSNKTLGNLIYSSTTKYRDIFDDLARQHSGATWWIEINSNTGESVFYFTDTVLAKSGVTYWDFSSKVTLSSYGINVIGYVNDVVVVGGGNNIITNPTEDGSEIFDTKRIYGDYSVLDRYQQAFRAPTIFNPTIYGADECLKRAHGIILTSEMVNNALSHPEFMAISPKLADVVTYTLGPVRGSNAYNVIQTPYTITGVVIGKRVEFSASGWVCQLKLKPIHDASDTPPGYLPPD